MNVANIITAGMMRHHLDRVVQRSRRQSWRVAGRLPHRVVAQIDQTRIERTRLDAPQRAATRP